MIEFIQTSGDNINILHTAGDTFKFVAAPDEEIPEATSLRLQISQNGRTDNILVEKSFTISNNEFTIELDVEELAPLIAGSEYYYRLTMFTISGEIVTTISGDLIVKWGA